MKGFSSKKFSIRGWIGILFIIIFWFLNWNLSGLRTNLLFFPLWLGYILTVDAIVFYRNHSSLITLSKKGFITLFFISAPAWWLFELINAKTQNWFYDGRQFFTDIEYAILATISFSTVMPAVFSTAELFNSLKWIKKFENRKPLFEAGIPVLKFFFTGMVMIILIILFPSYFYYLEWIAVYFIIEPINYKLNNRTLLSYLTKGNWSIPISLSLGTLMCGFFWELWNYYSYPKWIYDTPMVNFFHVFEMPLLGYIGYIPFSWELFALYNFVTGLIFKMKQDFILPDHNF